MLLADNPHASRVAADPFYTRGLVRGLGGSERYDVAFHTLNTVHPKWLWRSVAARVPERIGHAYPFRPEDDFTSLFTRRVPLIEGRHDVEGNLDLLRALPGSLHEAGSLELALPDSAREEAEKRWSRRSGGPVVGLCPGSSGWMSFKRWPRESYVELAEALAREVKDVELRVFCGPDEADEAAFWRERMDGRVEVVEGLPLPTYAAALERCDALVCNDSLPVHIASALEVPVVGLYGPTDPRRTGPWKGPHRVVHPEGDWTPYFRVPYPPDPGRYPPYMARIPTERVLQAVLELLAERRPAPAD